MSATPARRDLPTPAGMPLGPSYGAAPQGPNHQAAAPQGSTFTAPSNGPMIGSGTPVKRSGFKSGLRDLWRCFKRHLVDWGIVIVLAVVWIVLSTVPKPTHRYADASYFATSPRFPTISDSISQGNLFVICFVVPVVVIFLTLLVRRSAVDFHNAILGLIFSLLLTFIATAFVKVSVGALRPDFYFRCFPDGIARYQANGDVACTGEHDIVREGRLSFFSGHTSGCFAGLGFLAWFLAAKCRVGDMKGHISRLILPYLCLSGATLVGISRWADYKHRFLDIIAGALVGLIISYACYRHFYPSLRHPRAQHPFEDADGLRPEFAAAHQRRVDLTPLPVYTSERRSVAL